MDLPIIKSLHIGKEASLAGTNFLSAINKSRIEGKCLVTKIGLKNDEQADKINHGGLEKAIHQYAFENYNYWKEKLLECTILDNAGAFGENISSLGMDEHTVRIGDQYKLGTCILEVSQARQPCWKLNYRFNHTEMSEEVQNSLKTGWYYRVIEEGEIEEGNKFELISRPFPDYPLQRLLNLLYKDALNFKELELAIKIKPLADSWKKLFLKRIETKNIENWQNRLLGATNK